MRISFTNEQPLKTVLLRFRDQITGILSGFDRLRRQENCSVAVANLAQTLLHETTAGELAATPGRVGAAVQSVGAVVAGKAANPYYCSPDQSE